MSKPKVSVCIPLLAASPLRRRNWRVITNELSALAERRGDIEIVAAEHTNNLAAGYEHIRRVQIQGAFCRSKARNVAWRAATSDLICFCDSDMLLRPGHWDEAIEEAQQHTCYSPYNKVWLMGPEKTANRVDENERFRWDMPINNGVGKKRKPFHANLFGGIAFATRDYLESIGGWDERFRGWGSEDTAMEKNAVVSGVKIGYGDRKAYHMYHEKDKTGARKNKRLYRREYAPKKAPAPANTLERRALKPAVTENDDQYPTITEFSAVTSVSPGRLDHQRHCLQTWKDFGLEIVAVNTADENEALHDEFPMVDLWLETSEVTDCYRKVIPRVNALADAARYLGKPILMMNSDIEIHGPQRLLLAQVKPDTAIVGIRHNYNQDVAKATREPWGMDAFYLTPEMTSQLPRLGLGIGKPCWDYWMVAHLRELGVESSYIGYPLFFHKKHPLRWSKQDDRIGERIIKQAYANRRAALPNANLRAKLPFGVNERRVPRIILCNGMIRSGSTWMYNAVRMIAAQNLDPDEISCGWCDHPNDYKGAAFQIVKAHGPDYVALQKRAELVLHSNRDIRDVMASRVRMWNHSPSVSMADALVKESEYFAEHADYVMRYEDMIDDPIAEIERLAAMLGFPVDAAQAKEDIEALPEMPKGKTHYNQSHHPTTLLHPDHRTFGEGHAEVSRTLIDEVVKKHYGWFAKHGYVERKVALIRREDSHGFFSHFHTAMELSAVAEADGFIPVIDQRTGMNLYRSEPDENIWSTYFQQDINPEDHRGATVRTFRHRANYPYRYFPPVRVSDKKREFCRDFVRRNAQFRPEILASVDQLQQKYGLDDYLCLYFRGTDKRTEFREPRFDDYLNHAERFLRNDPKLKILVQSDDQRFVNFMNARIDDAIVIDEFAISADGNPIHFAKGRPPRELAMEAISIMLLLARSKYLVANTSNVSHTAVYYRDSDEGVAFVGPKR